MKRLIDLYKYYFTTDILELELTIFDVFIIVITLLWAMVLTLFIPCALISSLINN